VPDATSQFLNYISSTWDQTIPLKTLWTLQFTSLPEVIRSVDTILAGTERTSTSVAKFPTNKNISDLSYSSFTASTLLAQKITFPSDSVLINTTRNDNMGGLFGGYYSTQRENYNSINVDFLETNKDIIDFIMRPWLIAATYKGLIEDNELSIKTDMIVSLYSKYDQDTWAGRKNIKFEGVIPVSTPGDTLNYESSNNAAIIRPVSLAFKRYYVLD
jgi:hypothetical protein